MPKAGAQLLEPIMNVDVFTPEDHVGDVIGDLNWPSWHDQRSTSWRNWAFVLKLTYHLEMFGYIGHLRTITSGRGQFSMEFAVLSMPNERGRRSNR